MKKKIVAWISVLVVFLASGGLMSYAVWPQDSKETSQVDEIREKIDALDTYNDAAITDVDQIQGKIYYVDPLAEEGNDGLAETRALKTLDEVNQLELEPGDAVLFRRNGEWNGSLKVAHSGTKEKPIIYGSYGEGEYRPALHGNGTAYAVISGTDVSGITVENLEVTNEGDQTRFLRGIFFQALDENVSTIVIRNCYVHDVDSDGESLPGQDAHWTGGIIVASSRDGICTELVQMDDILIEGNRVAQCSSLGITAGAGDSIVPLATNIRIIGNEVSECYGDAILLRGADRSVVEGNVARNNGTRAKAAVAYAGIWCLLTTNSVIQYNEVYGQQTSKDGQAFDIDYYCDNITIQYNYSHDNAGGFLLVMDQGLDGRHTVRYNVSHNDQQCFISTTLARGSGGTKHQQIDVYNNTFYTRHAIQGLFRSTAGTGAERIYYNVRNNIFCVENVEKPDVFTKSHHSRHFVFANNCWYGFGESLLPSDEPGQIVENPKFVDPTSKEENRALFDGLKLLEGSPCLGTGIDVVGNATEDSWGNKISDTLNIGAYAGKAAKPTGNTNIAAGKTVTMSSTAGIKILQKATCALMTDTMVDVVGSTQPTENAKNREWFEIDLDGTYDISKIVLYSGEDNDIFPKKFNVLVGDGDNWKKVVTQRKDIFDAEQSEYEFTFKAVEGSKIRVEVVEMRANEEGLYCAALSEIEAYSK